ncbi:LysR substrate-binding domain-containing protein, partial [Pseudomonas sp. HY13-MNA-CIBAN-0226]
MTLHQIGDEELSGTLKVRVMPSFASKWLLPRMPSFNQAYPGIQLEVEADLSTPNFNSDGVDLA